ncbi:MAG: ROK family protein [archaeon]
MIIGLDLGGTSIKVGLIKDGKLIKVLRMPTQTNKGKKVVLKNIMEAISLIKEGYNIKGIGIGVPGFVDNKRGIIIKSPNIPFKNLNLRDIIKNRFKTRVEIDNDAKCAALAEKVYGKGKNFRNFIVITLGTGIGSGVFIDNKVYRGRLFASELGHMIIANEKEHCHLNHYSCLESLCSCNAISKQGEMIFRKYMKAIEIIKLCDGGNLKARFKARKIIDKASRYLGIGLANIINIFNPEIIFIDKGIKGGRYFLNRIKEETKKNAMFKCKIEFSEIDDAGILGAASLVE